MKFSVKSDFQRPRRNKRAKATIGRRGKTPANRRYRVGDHHPPREHRWGPGQSGNPKGRKPTPPIAAELKALLERALRDKVTLPRGKKEKAITKAAAGIQHLVNQFAKGDRFARRDLIAIAQALGIDLTVGQSKSLENAITQAVSAEDEALLEEYVEFRIRERLGGGAEGVPRLPKPESPAEAEPVDPEERKVS